MDMDGQVPVLLYQYQRARTDTAQGMRFLQDRIEHGSEVAWRGIDHPKHFGGRGLLFERLVALGFVCITLGCALGKLTFEIGYPLLGTGERVVGRRAHVADLIRADFSGDHTVSRWSTIGCRGFGP